MGSNGSATSFQQVVEQRVIHGVFMRSPSGILAATATGLSAELMATIAAWHGCVATKFTIFKCELF
jgi:hypothetical protein